MLYIDTPLLVAALSNEAMTPHVYTLDQRLVQAGPALGVPMQLLE